jgi:hypothetical protein
MKYLAEGDDFDFGWKCGLEFIEMEKNIVKARHKKDMWWAERERAAEREYEQKKLQWQLGANARLSESSRSSMRAGRGR